MIIPAQCPHDMLLSRQGLWFMGRRLPCSIGRGGRRLDKREGDGATPVGVHRITGMLYRPDRLAAPSDWARPIRPGDLWSDDGADPDYNHLVRAKPTQHRYPFSHEALRRGDPLYDIVLLSDWNWPEARAGQGSAIFLHQRRRPGYPTEGCIAFSRNDLRWLCARLTPGTRLIVPPL